MLHQLLIPIEEHIKKDYYIYFSHTFKEEWIKLIQEYKYSKFVIITDQNVYNYYKELINFLLHSLNPSLLIIRPAGEEYKHIKYLQEIYEKLIQWNIDRKSCILALGGGVIGDFAGYIASTILRGIDFIQIPTTLLAMVDSSVGGKVAVNVDMGKNMIGSFYQPKMVLCNTGFLNTLPEKEWICGLSEMVKHSLLDRHVYHHFQTVVQKHNHYKNWNDDLWNELIYESIKVKANVVSKDEKETGLRSILNLGHTVAHAIESYTNYKQFSHGEAVSRGLLTALLLSKQKYNFPDEKIQEIITTMKYLNLPLDTAGIQGEDLISHFSFDKKNQYGKIKYIYLKDIGEPIFDDELNLQDFLHIWKEQKSLFG